MPWDVIFFYLIGTISVLTALGVVAARNPVHSGIFLVLCFLNIAAIFVMLGAEFLAVIQIIVYTGAILVLVLFVIMLVEPEELPSFHTAQPLQRYLSLLLGAVLLLEVAAAIITRTAIVNRGNATPENIAAVGGNVQALGRVIYSNYLLAFEVTSLVLTVGVIGAVVLALPERLGERVGTRRGTISLSHSRGTDAALPEGPRGETPIKVDRTRPEPAPAMERTIIMTKDPDAHTRVGGAAGNSAGSGSSTAGTGTVTRTRIRADRDRQ
ncbi:MAG: NADH-ubiquinone oxidoreductase chain J [uncultured Thermomicrobiales bacterium]|uniref:NADH-quinone oxidoreductase subunit J n=1 Tax=uncultured Thermomicrobiales bacterium TaxID=1645740 RepID=A0A6J4UC28_9BACT|nr:MAG: NADH-ubiquinone oxidoreductase chain J [uncultured Thermomicrobiales bacterium]